MHTVSSNPWLTVPLVALPELPLTRAAMDELYHFLQYLQFKYQMDLERAIAAIADEMDIVDSQAALAEGEGLPWHQVKQALGLDEA